MLVCKVTIWNVNCPRKDSTDFRLMRTCSTETIDYFMQKIPQPTWDLDAQSLDLYRPLYRSRNIAAHRALRKWQVGPISRMNFFRRSSNSKLDTCMLFLSHPNFNKNDRHENMYIVECVRNIVRTWLPWTYLRENSFQWIRITHVTQKFSEMGRCSFLLDSTLDWRHEYRWLSTTLPTHCRYCSLAQSHWHYQDIPQIGHLLSERTHKQSHKIRLQT